MALYLGKKSKKGRLAKASKVVKNPGRDGGDVTQFTPDGKPIYESDKKKNKPNLSVSVGLEGSKVVTHRGRESKPAGAGHLFIKKANSSRKTSVTVQDTPVSADSPTIKDTPVTSESTTIQDVPKKADKTEVSQDDIPTKVEPGPRPEDITEHAEETERIEPEEPPQKQQLGSPFSAAQRAGHLLTGAASVSMDWTPTKSGMSFYRKNPQTGEREYITRQQYINMVNSAHKAGKAGYGAAWGGGGAVGRQLGAGLGGGGAPISGTAGAASTAMGVGQRMGAPDTPEPETKGEEEARTHEGGQWQEDEEEEKKAPVDKRSPEEIEKEAQAKEARAQQTDFQQAMQRKMDSLKELRRRMEEGEAHRGDTKLYQKLMNEVAADKDRYLSENFQYAPTRDQIEFASGAKPIKDLPHHEVAGGYLGTDHGKEQYRIHLDSAKKMTPEARRHRLEELESKDWEHWTGRNVAEHSALEHVADQMGDHARQREKEGGNPHDFSHAHSADKMAGSHPLEVGRVVDGKSQKYIVKDHTSHEGKPHVMLHGEDGKTYHAPVDKFSHRLKEHADKVTEKEKAQIPESASLKAAEEKRKTPLIRSVETLITQVQLEKAWMPGMQDGSAAGQFNSTLDSTEGDRNAGKKVGGPKGEYGEPLVEEEQKGVNPKVAGAAGLAATMVTPVAAGGALAAKAGGEVINRMQNFQGKSLQSFYGGISKAVPGFLLDGGIGMGELFLSFVELSKAHGLSDSETELSAMTLLQKSLVASSAENSLIDGKILDDMTSYLYLYKGGGAPPRTPDTAKETKQRYKDSFGTTRTGVAAQSPVGEDEEDEKMDVLNEKDHSIIDEDPKLMVKAQKVKHYGARMTKRDLPGDKELVGQYKRSGKVTKPKRRKGESASAFKTRSRQMASDLIRYHMHHLGRHPGGQKQAVAIGLRQAGISKEKSMNTTEDLERKLYPDLSDAWFKKSGRNTADLEQAIADMDKGVVAALGAIGRGVTKLGTKVGRAAKTAVKKPISTARKVSQATGGGDDGDFATMPPAAFQASLREKAIKEKAFKEKAIKAKGIQAHTPPAVLKSMKKMQVLTEEDERKAAQEPGAGELGPDKPPEKPKTTSKVPKVKTSKDQYHSGKRAGGKLVGGAMRVAKIGLV